MFEVMPSSFLLLQKGPRAQNGIFKIFPAPSDLEP